MYILIASETIGRLGMSYPSFKVEHRAFEPRLVDSENEKTPYLQVLLSQMRLARAYAHAVHPSGHVLADTMF